MASGDLDVRLPISKARDEFDAIAFGINILADEVQFRYANDADRTAELHAALERLNVTVHELKETQGQLIQSAKMAALGEFSSGLAHEINNPLTIIRVYADKIARLYKRGSEVSFEEVAPFLEKINSNVDRMAKTIQHVKDFSRRTEDSKTQASLNEIVKNSLEFVHAQVELKKIRLEVVLAPDPVLIEADAVAIEHVILNIVSNACDAIEEFQPTNGGIIRLSTEANGSEVRLVVQDNGRGISAENLDKIYQPFFTTKPAGRGTGIGLSISYQIVSTHNGRIDCVSKLGTGTTFTVCFPRGRA